MLYDINNSDNLLDLEPLDLRLGVTWKVLPTLDVNLDAYDLFDKTEEPRVEEGIYFDTLDRIRAGIQFSGLRTGALEFPLRLGYDGTS